MNIITTELLEGARAARGCAVIIDVFRAFTLECYLFAGGAGRILTVGSADTAYHLKEEHPEKVISLLIERQENALADEISEKQEKLEKLHELKAGLKNKESFSIESIGDIATIMEDRKKLKRMHLMMLYTGIQVTALQWFSVIFWIVKGIWWPFIVWTLVAVTWGTLISRYYFKHVKYICPECHEVFKPAFKEAFWANHTPTARKLTCTSCGRKGFCIEVWGGDAK